MRTYLAVAVFSATILVAPAQAGDLLLPDYLEWNVKEESKSRITKALDSLFLKINEGTTMDGYLASENEALTAMVLASLKGLDQEGESRDTRSEDTGSGVSKSYSKRLINAYPISKTGHWLTIAFSEHQDSTSKIRMVFNLIAEERKDGVTFTIPLSYLTRYWKSEVVGNIEYFSRGSIDRARAEKFDKKNTAIAKKLGLEAERFRFYMCDNYQEILALLGFEYDSEVNGVTRDGYGVAADAIFSIMNNEDFSHDIFHYYSGKINQRIDRNSIAEEGVAYSWGNAYYTDPQGEMIEQRRLVTELRAYLKVNPNTDLLDLFEKNTKIFAHLAPDLSVRSTLSSLICDEVERTKGMEGLQRLIGAGRRPSQANYLQAISELLGIDKANFNSRLAELLERYE